MQVLEKNRKGLPPKSTDRTIPSESSRRREVTLAIPRVSTLVLFKVSVVVGVEPLGEVPSLPADVTTSTTLRPHYDHTTTPLRPHYDHTTTPLRPHYDPTTTTLRPHYDHTTTTLRPHFLLTRDQKTSRSGHPSIRTQPQDPITARTPFHSTLGIPLKWTKY